MTASSCLWLRESQQMRMGSCCLSSQPNGPLRSAGTQQCGSSSARPCPAQLGEALGTGLGMVYMQNQRSGSYKFLEERRMGRQHSPQILVHSNSRGVSEWPSWGWSLESPPPTHTMRWMQATWSQRGCGEAVCADDKQKTAVPLLPQLLLIVPPCSLTHP